ncbi:MAG: 3-deoxy-D-manno-octulosonic-acid transferase [Rhodobacteraceae bacterium HLUCCA12]|nr:MAG: 3-deoxy-D-manno-octulosonic-acid transferase [Rhodobacteraceae bacterium HLUCCA12]
MRAIPGLRAYQLLGRPDQRSQPAAAAVAGGGGAASTCWLHATEPGEYDPLRLLAAQLGELRKAPQCLVTGNNTHPGPGEEPAEIDAWLDRLRPSLLVLAGTVLPPSLIEQTRARGIAMMLVNATHAAPPGRWRLWPGFTRGLLAAFSQIHARDEQAARGFARLMRGAVPVSVSGALARFAPAASCNHSELGALRTAIAGRPAWFAYSLPPSEVEAAFAAHAHALRRSHRLLLILAPRDPRDAAQLAEQASAMSFNCARRMLDQEIGETTQVYIADTDDEPGLFMRLAPVSFLGGSLTRDAGTPPPLLAAALGSALVFGPHAGPEAGSFLEQLRRVGGGRRIAAAPDLGEAVSALLSPEIGAEAALKAWSLATEGSDATRQVAHAICDWMQINSLQGAA